MPEIGRYAKKPRPESTSIFLKYLSSNKRVKTIKQLSDQEFEIEKENGSTLLIYLTNIYIVSLADVHEILSVNRNVQAIVTMSAWNSYSPEAKDFCLTQEIGLYKFKEFLGAIYYDGKSFLNYCPKKDN